MSDHRTDFSADLFISDAERDPVKAARYPARVLPKRFYTEATVAEAEGGFAVLLDSKPVNTPAKRKLVVPSKALAEALAQEWAAQGEKIDPATMPLTRLTNTALDGIASRMLEVEAEIAKYAASDLICYRAGAPASLVAAQTAVWDPLVAFARDRLGARLTLAEGVMFVEQPQAALDALKDAIRAYVGEGGGAPLRLAALHVMTTITGSLVIALAAVMGEIDLETAWAAANVDEDFQTRAWGADAVALARREARFRETRAAAFLSDRMTQLRR